jgi:hypothetical protein
MLEWVWRIDDACRGGPGIILFRTYSSTPAGGHAQPQLAVTAVEPPFFICFWANTGGSPCTRRKGTVITYLFPSFRDLGHLDILRKP